jgi:hypothetical protein
MKQRIRSFVAITIVMVLFVMTNGSNATSGHTPDMPVITVSGPAVLDDWGNRFVTLGSLVPENALRTQVRTTIAQMAMFDAVNAVLDGLYRSFASKPSSALGASPEAAAIRAAYIVALHEFPTTLSATIDTAYNNSIAALIAGPQAIAEGIVVGEAAATAVLTAREQDRRNDPDLTGYVPGSGPGVWVPTAPAFATPQTPFLRYVTPFGYEDPARFRPAAPPTLDSKTYTTDYNESKDLGRAGESSRTAEQSATAQFWSPSAVVLWTANIRSLAGSMDLLTAARFEALGFAAVTNALIAAWDGKYTYMFWRPVTAIRAGDLDGNPATERDPTWTAFITTPSHPEYPAAHTTIGASTLGFYTVWFETDQFPLTIKGSGGVRNYTNFNEIHAEEGNARVWGGMHWRNSTEVGTAVGSKVGKYTATHLLQALD